MVPAHCLLGASWGGSELAGGGQLWYPPRWGLPFPAPDSARPGVARGREGHLGPGLKGCGAHSRSSEGGVRGVPSTG